MPEELYTSRDFCELAEEFEELKRENEELVSDKTYLINAAMDGGDKYHYTAHDIAYRDLERKCKALEAENVALREYIEGLDPRWIPVSERLPEENVTVLVVTKRNRKPVVAWMRLGLWCSRGVDFALSVTHWMPLPNPPEVQQ